MNTTDTVGTTDSHNDINTFRPYEPTLEYPAIKGFRMVKCLYKKPKTGEAAGENSYIRIEDNISEQAVADFLPKLSPYFVTFLQEQQNALVKEMHKAGKTKVSVDSYSLDSLVSYLEEQGKGNRLNKEKIEAWFNESVYDSLVVAFSEKLGLDENLNPSEEELEKLEQIIGVYKNKFASLAGGKTHYRKEEAELLQKALEVSGADETILGSRFNDRLEKMKTVSSDDLLLSL